MMATALQVLHFLRKSLNAYCQLRFTDPARANTQLMENIELLATAIRLLTARKYEFLKTNIFLQTV